MFLEAGNQVGTLFKVEHMEPETMMGTPSLLASPNIQGLIFR